MFLKKSCFVWNVKNTERKIPEGCKDKSGRIMISSHCAVCGSKRSRFVKNLETTGLLSSLGIQSGLDKIPIIGLILF